MKCVGLNITSSCPSRNVRDLKTIKEPPPRFWLMPVSAATIQQSSLLVQLDKDYEKKVHLHFSKAVPSTHEKWCTFLARFRDLWTSGVPQARQRESNLVFYVKLTKICSRPFQWSLKCSVFYIIGEEWKYTTAFILYGMRRRLQIIYNKCSVWTQYHN